MIGAVDRIKFNLLLNIFRIFNKSYFSSIKFVYSIVKFSLGSILKDNISNIDLSSPPGALGRLAAARGAENNIFKKDPNKDFLTNDLYSYLAGLWEGSYLFFVLLSIYFFSLIISFDHLNNGYSLLFILFSYNNNIKDNNERDLKKKIRRLSLKEKEEFKISQGLKEILIGLFLGDLHAQKRYENGNVRLLFEQGEVHSKYLLHLFDLFKDFCQAEPKTSSRYDKRTEKVYTRIKFSTFTLPCYDYHDLFYLNGSKILPSNLEELITSRSLAYWAMDDGSKTGAGFRLNTNSFTKDQNYFLIKVLKDKFDLDCTLNLHSKDQYRIYISAKSMDKFRDLVSPYFHESMMYKLNKNENDNYENEE